MVFYCVARQGQDRLFANGNEEGSSNAVQLAVNAPQKYSPKIVGHHNSCFFSVVVGKCSLNNCAIAK